MKGITANSLARCTENKETAIEWTDDTSRIPVEDRDNEAIGRGESWTSARTAPVVGLTRTILLDGMEAAARMSEDGDQTMWVMLVPEVVMEWRRERVLMLRISRTFPFAEATVKSDGEGTASPRDTGMAEEHCISSRAV